MKQLIAGQSIVLQMYSIISRWFGNRSWVGNYSMIVNDIR